MTILALESTMAACSAAIATQDGDILAQRFEEMTRGQSERLIPMAEAVLAEADLPEASIDPSTLSLIAVACGPGAFTGVRLCLAAARGFGLALGVPVGALPTTEILAAAQPKGTGPLLIAIDSKRGDFFIQYVTEDGHAEAPTAAAATDIATLGRDRVNGSMRVAGDATDAVLKILEEAGVPGAAAGGPTLPDAAVLAQLAASRMQQFGADHALYGLAKPEPMYLRAPDVSAPSRDRARAPGSNPAVTDLSAE